MKRLLLALTFALGLGSTAQAQVLVDGRPPASGVTLDQVQAIIPQPANITPPSESTAAATGAQTMRYALEDHVHQRITRAQDVTTDASGYWAASWASMPLAQAPAVWPIAINSTTQPVICNVTTRTTTGATGRCWISRTLPATLTVLTNLISYDLFGTPAATISVQVLAIPKTQ